MNSNHELLSLVCFLKIKLLLPWLKIDISYKIYDEIGKKLSHVRPCFEFFKHGQG